MNRCPYAAKALILGLLVAQVLATVHVYLSNVELFRTLSAVKEAGYLVVPNETIMSRLHEFGPAFFGGLFFTFSVGAGLSMLSLSAAWLWDRLLIRNKPSLTLFVMLWIAGLLVANLPWFCLMVTLYFVAIPLVVFLAALRWMPHGVGERLSLPTMVHFVPVLLLALLWTSQMDAGFFLAVRDKLLLSNAPGRQINDFYYKYTLYPAEAFKSLDQKILKTCHIDHPSEESFLPHIERALLNNDYLPLQGDPRVVDMTIGVRDNMLLLGNTGNTILQATLEEFLAAPGAMAKEFSQKTDRYPFFRLFTYYSLLIGLPLILYVFLYTLFRLVLCFFLDERASSMSASILCFLAGISLLVLFQYGKGAEIKVEELEEALESERWQRRVAALKIVRQKGMDVADFPAYQSIRSSPHIVERYWLVNALGASRHPGTYEDILAFLDDPHPNVVCMAFNALGQKGETRAVDKIIKRIEMSDHWYEQWYAYKSLRSLGWKQRKSR
jgi:Ca2+/Na+ antiporter